MAFTVADYGDSVTIQETNGEFTAYLIGDNELRCFRSEESVVNYLRAFSASHEYWAKVVDWLKKTDVPALPIFNGAFTDTWVKRVPPNYLDDSAYGTQCANPVHNHGEQIVRHHA